MRRGLVKQYRRSHRLRRKVLRAVLLLVIFGLPLAAFWFGIRNSPSQSLIAQVARDGWRAAMNVPELPPDYRSGRQMFPYSVVPGGLRNMRDAEDAIGSDPVVALHYRDLHLENLGLRRTAAAMDVFVSYRVRNGIYWTSHRIHMAKGELVLVDGKNLVRARCGNRIAFELPPEAPKAFPIEPPPEVFEYGLPPAFTPDEPLLTPGPDYWPPALVAPMPCCGGYVGGPVDPIATTPEPSTLLLVGAGILLVVMRMKFRKRP